MSLLAQFLKTHFAFALPFMFLIHLPVITGTAQTDVVTNEMWNAKPIESIDSNHVGKTFAGTTVQALPATKQSAKMRRWMRYW